MHRVELAPAAQRQIKKLPRQVQDSILKQLEKLKLNPKPYGAKKLAGMDNLYRIRIGDYRIIYTINNQFLSILVVKVGNRNDVYCNLSSVL